jgi:outer membrane protein assembly factor BamB
MFLFLVIIYGVQNDPEPDVILLKDVSIDESINWLTYRFDVRHLGIAPLDCQVDSEIVLEWKTKRLNINDYGASKSSPAVYSDKIFLGLDTGELISVDRVSGELQWSFPTRRSKNGIHGSPTVNPEMAHIYIGAYDGWIYAVDTITGDYAWENRLGDYIGSSPVLFDGVVYIGVEMNEPAGYLVGVEAETGREVFRSRKFASHPHSTPTIDPESKCIIIGSNDSNLYCYSIDDGTELWRFKTGYDIKSTASVYDGIVYITCWDGYLYAIDITNGKEIWSFNSYTASMSSPTIDPLNGIVYFGNHAGRFYAVNITDGEMLWRYLADDRILSSPTLVKSTNTIIFGSDDGHVYLLDSLKGTLKQKVSLNSGLSGVPVTIGNQMYVFDNLGYLYSFKALKP